ncbi:hypothetical protein AYI68_g7911 [Smittium mucronatum]|uniref:Uncharacterized protein n=1 Tax=Smittium mucronatum TaxID=133383 RepID=A0A1R0GMC1_9FUNG|nr:hypothetical protein AYI68_g7911 [Smittium mucronatum]
MILLKMALECSPISDSKEDLQKSLDVISVWSDTWEMKENAKKFGIMGIGTDWPNNSTIQSQAIVRADS